MDQSRREKSRKAVENKRISEEKQSKSRITFVDDFESFLETQKKKTGISEDKLMDEILSSHVAIFEFDETAGKASLVYDGWKGSVVGEPVKVDYKTLQDFRDLRDNFAPVSAGVEWHRDFTSGGGFLVQIDDPTDKRQLKMQEQINLLNRSVFQDQYVKGLDNIMDIMMDTALTDGCAAAEIVYSKDVNFVDYVDNIEEVVLEDGKKVKVIVPKIMTSEDWRDLGGITRLKIIEDAYNRLIPYRHPLSGEILYWTLDEKCPMVNQGLSYSEILDREKKSRKAVIKFHPWEILWLSWNTRGTNLKGLSIIQPVYRIAKMVQEIQTSIGKGFNRWANKKYFFVCGSEKRQWNKIYRQEFLKAMEKMVKNNWIGIPVPAAFDVKNIGGEESVFDGKNILDHLISMIAAGMQYPIEFLEGGRTQASDKAWLAWTVRYGRSQLQIRRAIEHQLWERHLWCKNGMTFKSGKKGVAKEEQENVPIYVPKLQWRAEGQWHRDTKIKMLTGLLNVANPIDYPLKMPIQKEMGKTIGIGEVDWTAIEKLFDIKNKVSMAIAEMDLLKENAKLDMMKKMSVEELANMIKVQNVPQPKTPEEKLKEQEEKRAEHGVSRTTKETGTQSKKGQAKEMGGSRGVQETTEIDPKDLIDTDKLTRFIEGMLEHGLVKIKDELINNQPKEKVDYEVLAKKIREQISSEDAELKRITVEKERLALENEKRKQKKETTNDEIDAKKLANDEEQRKLNIEKEKLALKEQSEKKKEEPKEEVSKTPTPDEELKKLTVEKEKLAIENEKQKQKRETTDDEANIKKLASDEELRKLEIEKQKLDIEKQKLALKEQQEKPKEDTVKTSVVEDELKKLRIEKERLKLENEKKRKKQLEEVEEKLKKVK